MKSKEILKAWGVLTKLHDRLIECRNSGEPIASSSARVQDMIHQLLYEIKELQNLLTIHEKQSGEPPN